MYRISTHTDTQSQISIHSYIAEIYKRVLYMMTADFQSAPHVVLIMFYFDPMWVHLASWRNQSLSCVSRHWEPSLKRKKDDKSIWIIPLSTKSSSQAYLISLGVTCAVLLQSLFQSLNSGKRLQNGISVWRKGTTCWRTTPAALQGLRQAVAPSAFPTGLQIKLNKWRSHAGQRLWGHMTCHAAFSASSFIL